MGLPWMSPRHPSAFQARASICGLAPEAAAAKGFLWLEVAAFLEVEEGLIPQVRTRVFVFVLICMVIPDMILRSTCFGPCVLFSPPVHDFIFAACRMYWFCGMAALACFLHLETPQPVELEICKTAPPEPFVYALYTVVGRNLCAVRVFRRVHAHEQMRYSGGTV